MSKKTRAERRAEEARIIAEMESAMQENGAQTASPSGEKRGNDGGKYRANAEKMHCKRCRAVMENGVCPVCGFRVYVPMDEKKRKKIRIVVAAACIVVFVALFVALRLW